MSTLDVKTALVVEKNGHSCPASGHKAESSHFLLAILTDFLPEADLANGTPSDSRNILGMASHTY